MITIFIIAFQSRRQKPRNRITKTSARADNDICHLIVSVETAYIIQAHNGFSSSILVDSLFVFAASGPPGSSLRLWATPELEPRSLHSLSAELIFDGQPRPWLTWVWRNTCAVRLWLLHRDANGYGIVSATRRVFLRRHQSSEFDRFSN